MAKRVVVGSDLRSIRELAGLSQKALARQIGISKSALSQIEAGGGMKPENIKRAAEILGVSITAFTQIEGEPVVVPA